MYHCDKGIVLRHRDINESDRLVTVFSYNYGKIEVNFKSVRKSHSKLKALSELFTYGDFRFYSRKHGSMPLCIGGSVISSYPELRDSLDKIIMLSFLSDMVISLTPLYQKSEEKFNLLLSSLNYLSSTEKVSRWFVPVFMFNLLEFYGTGFKNTNIGYDSDFWSLVHTNDFSHLPSLSRYDELYQYVLEFAISEINEHSNRKFNIPKFNKTVVLAD